MGNSCRSMQGVSRMEVNRQEGQQLLQDLIVQSDNQIDWCEIVRQAEYFHRREQKYLKRLERRWNLRSAGHAAKRRKQYDAIGSFSVNLLTITKNENEKPTSGMARWNILKGPRGMGSQKTYVESVSSGESMV